MRSAGAVDVQVGEQSVGVFGTDVPLHHRQVAQELHSPAPAGVNVWLLSRARAGMRAQWMVATGCEYDTRLVGAAQEGTLPEYTSGRATAPPPLDWTPTPPQSAPAPVAPAKPCVNTERERRHHNGITAQP